MHTRAVPSVQDSERRSIIIVPTGFMTAQIRWLAEVMLVHEGAVAIVLAALLRGNASQVKFDILGGQKFGVEV